MLKFHKTSKNPWNFTSKFLQKLIHNRNCYEKEFQNRLGFKKIFILNTLTRPEMKSMALRLLWVKYIYVYSNQHSFSFFFILSNSWSKYNCIYLTIFLAFSSADYNQSLEPIRKFITNSNAQRYSFDESKGMIFLAGSKPKFSVLFTCNILFLDSKVIVFTWGMTTCSRSWKIAPENFKIFM